MDKKQLINESDAVLKDTSLPGREEEVIDQTQQDIRPDAANGENRFKEGLANNNITEETEKNK